MTLTLYVTLFFLVLLIILGCWEKRLSWPYGTPGPVPAFEDPNNYGYARVAELMQYGFVLFGWCPDLKGEKYQVSYAMLVAPDRECFVVVGTGRIIGITMNTTWLYSRGQDDRLYYSTDHQNGADIDISHTQRCHLVPGTASFTGLWQEHAHWLQQDGIRTQPFDTGAEMECFSRLRHARFQNMLDRGFIKYTDETNTWWRYRFLGSVRHAVVNYAIGIVRAVTGGKVPRSI